MHRYWYLPALRKVTRSVPDLPLASDAVFLPAILSSLELSGVYRADEPWKRLERRCAIFMDADQSGGYLGLVLGAILTGYMSYFVGSYAAASGHPIISSVEPGPNSPCS